MLFLKNEIQKRQFRSSAPFPDALDLLLICVESGMSIEAAFRKVSAEIGSQSIPLAEEFTLTTAELVLSAGPAGRPTRTWRSAPASTASNRSASRCSRRNATARRSAQTLRVMAQENRDMRMNEAEKKAAALPPKLTVPMILFFLPVLFVVILGPAAIRVAAMQ